MYHGFCSRIFLVIIKHAVPRKAGKRVFNRFERERPVLPLGPCSINKNGERSVIGLVRAKERKGELLRDPRPLEAKANSGTRLFQNVDGKILSDKIRGKRL